MNSTRILSLALLSLQAVFADSFVGTVSNESSEHEQDETHSIVKLDGSRFKTLEVVVFGDERLNLTLNFFVFWDSVTLESVTLNRNYRILNCLFPFNREIGYSINFEEIKEFPSEPYFTEHTLENGNKRRIWYIPWGGKLDVKFSYGIFSNKSMGFSRSFNYNKVIIVEQ